MGEGWTSVQITNNTKKTHKNKLVIHNYIQYIMHIYPNTIVSINCRVYRELVVINKAIGHKFVCVLLLERPHCQILCSSNNLKVSFEMEDLKAFQGCHEQHAPCRGGAELHSVYVLDGLSCELLGVKHIFN